MTSLKDTTEEILDEAMEFNTEVQADHLSMQNTCAELIRLAKEQSDIACVYRNINDKTCDSCAELYLELPGMEGYELTQDVVTRMEQLRNVLSEKSSHIQRQIAQEAYAMLNGAIADLDKVEIYPRIHNVFTEPKIMLGMDYYAWENQATTLKELLTSIASLAGTCISYEDLKLKFFEKSELNCLLAKMMVTDDDYITMNIVNPKVDKFNLTDEQYNSIGPMLNSIADEATLKSLADMKHQIMHKINSADPVDGIKTAHFAAQVIMAVKNATILLRKYHKACTNEII